MPRGQSEAGYVPIPAAGIRRDLFHQGFRAGVHERDRVNLRFSLTRVHGRDLLHGIRRKQAVGHEEDDVRARRQLECRTEGGSRRRTSGPFKRLEPFGDGGAFLPRVVPPRLRVGQLDVVEEDQLKSPADLHGGGVSSTSCLTYSTFGPSMLPDRSAMMQKRLPTAWTPMKDAPCPTPPPAPGSSDMVAPPPNTPLGTRSARFTSLEHSRPPPPESPLPATPPHPPIAAPPLRRTWRRGILGGRVAQVLRRQRADQNLVAFATAAPPQVARDHGQADDQRGVQQQRGQTGNALVDPG